MFIGREMELKFLSDKYRESGGQLIVWYVWAKLKPCESFVRGSRISFFPALRRQTGCSLGIFQTGY